MDENCKALAFPYLFPTDKYDYRVRRYIQLSPVKYFNQYLLNFTQIFASKSNYNCYALLLTQELKINSQMNITLKKMCTGQLTAGMIINNFSCFVNSLLSKNDAYQFMGTIKATPAYWK